MDKSQFEQMKREIINSIIDTDYQDLLKYGRLESKFNIGNMGLIFTLDLQKKVKELTIEEKLNKLGFTKTKNIVTFDNSIYFVDKDSMIVKIHNTNIYMYRNINELFNNMRYDYAIYNPSFEELKTVINLVRDKK